MFNRDFSISGKIGFVVGYPIGFIKGLFERLKLEVKKQIAFFKSRENSFGIKVVNALRIILHIAEKALSLLEIGMTVRAFKIVKKQVNEANTRMDKLLMAGSGVIAGSIVVGALALIKKIIKKIAKALDYCIAKAEMQSESRMSRDSMCFRCMNGVIMCDAGVKGMKKGQHVKARDPEYVESLRNGGGGGMSSGSSHSKPSGGNPILRSKKASIATGIGMGVAGSAAGLGLALKGGLLKGAPKKSLIAGAALGTGISAGIGALNGYASHKNYMRQQGINNILKKHGY